jgi:hypothetical protein
MSLFVYTRHHKDHKREAMKSELYFAGIAVQNERIGVEGETLLQDYRTPAVFSASLMRLDLEGMD